MASFNQFGQEIGANGMPTGGTYNSYLNTLNSNRVSNNFKNQYYDDALRNPDKYTWGIWDSSKLLSTDNWQPKPRQTGDARDTSSQRSNTSVNSRPTTVTSGVNVSSQQNSALDELTKQFYEYAKNNSFDSTYPKFNYDPNQGVIDTARMNADQYNQWKDSVIFNQDMAYRDLLEKDKASSAMANTEAQRRWREETQRQQMQQQADTAKAERERVNKMLEDQRKPISFTTIADPSSREVQAFNIMQNQQAQNKAYETNLLNNAELSKQSRLIPLQTQATMQINAPLYESQKSIADIKAEAEKAVAEATAKYQMYGANLNAMSSMFGSQMNAIGNMFGGMNTGGNARYW